MRIIDGAERAPMQCCAGPAPDWVHTAPHYATCPEVSQ